MPRLFVALADPDLGPELERAAREAVASLPGARAVGRDARHVTLAFIGEVLASRLPTIAEACAEAAAGGRRTHYVLDQIRGFPRSRARILALTGETPPGLADLAGRLAEQLLRRGVDVDRRPFHLHVTLARLRESVEIPAVRVDPLRVMAEEIRLYESELLPTGARYHLRSAFPLPAGKSPDA